MVYYEWIGGLKMIRKLSKSITQKDRPRIKNESKQEIIQIKYSQEVECGKEKVRFVLPPKVV